MEEKATIAESVIEHAKEYAKANFELAKLEAVNKGSEMASTAVSYVIGVVAIVMCGLILNIAIALLIGDLLGKLYYGFFIVAGFYMLISFAMFLGYKFLVVRPINSMAIRGYLKTVKNPKPNRHESIKIIRARKKRLEAIRDAELQHIKDELKAGYEYVRPINVIKRTLANAAKEPEIREDLFKIGLNMATGYLTNKIVPSKAGGAVKQWLSSFIKEKVGSYVSENGDTIKLAAEKFALKLLNKISGKKNTSPDPDSPSGEESKSAA